MYNKILKHLGLFGILFMMIQLMKLGVCMIESEYSTSYSMREVGLNSFLIIFVAYLSYIWCGIKEKVIDNQKMHIILGGLLVGIGRSVTLVGAIYYVLKQYIIEGIMSDVWIGIILTGVIIFVYVLMYIDYERDYERIINLEIYIFLIVIGIASNIFSSNSLNILGLAFITIIGALSKNQASIDHLLERTQKNTPMVIGLRKSNIKWVLLLMLFLLVAYAFRNVVVDGLQIIWQGIIYVLKIIIELLFKTNEEVPLELDSVEMSGTYEMMATGTPNPWYKMICFIILFILCIWKREEILAFIKWVYQTCMTRIKAVLKWLNKALFHVKKREVPMMSYYTEQVEEINSLQRVPEVKKKKLSKRKFSHQLKEANKIQDPNMKYRKKYKILIELLAWREVPILKSHTPRQICDETLKSKLKLDLEEETKGYEAVKYGEMAVGEEAKQAINTHLNQIMGQKG